MYCRSGLQDGLCIADLDYRMVMSADLDYKIGYVSRNGLEDELLKQI
jgi:hypothetical protein